MPEHLAPGVYIEEGPFGPKPIEGVDTTTTAFVGPTRYGPVGAMPGVVTSLGEFEATYGDGGQLVFGGTPRHNYMWHAVRQFFANGGTRLHVARVYGSYSPLTEPPAAPLSPAAAPAVPAGYAAASGIGPLVVAARFPGSGGNLRVRITVSAGPNVFSVEQGRNVVRSLVDGDTVLIAPTSGAVGDGFYLVETGATAGTAAEHRFRREGARIGLQSLGPNATVRVVTATVTVILPTAGAPVRVYEQLALDRACRRAGADNTFDARFALGEPSQAGAVPAPIVAWTRALPDGVTLARHLLSLRPSIGASLLDEESPDADRSIDLALTGGTDGTEPEAVDYEGFGDATSEAKGGLRALEALDDVAIVAAPGCTADFEARSARALAIVDALVSHATVMRDRFAIVDCGDRQSIADVRAMRGRLDTSYAALYFPWITIDDPITGARIDVPPSGCVAGIYVRTDISRGVFTAPANESVATATGLAFPLSDAQQEILNPFGVNCIRFFEGRGFRLWGARTASNDPEWKYVHVRRYLAYLEHSIDRGTRWAVFEPNGEDLWRRLRLAISDFLSNEWRKGGLLGDRPEKAFFVKCDRSTMTQADIDAGRWICLVGVAPLRPAEFVIFRIGHDVCGAS